VRSEDNMKTFVTLSLTSHKLSYALNLKSFSTGEMINHGGTLQQ